MSKFLINILLVPLKAYRALLSHIMRKYYAANGVSIGKNTYISPKAYLDSHKPAKIIIGENCYITRNVIILNHTDTRKGGPMSIWENIGGKREFADVVIGDNVFIAVGSVIMPGVKIGSDSIIGALSLVTKDVLQGTIVAGAPAKPIGNTLDHVRGIKC